MKKAVKQYLELLGLSGIEYLRKPEEIKPPTLTPEQKGLHLEHLRKQYANCKKCKLHQGRTNFVYGNGNPDARLVLIGEGPGEQEDKTGEVFVGPAGQLLTKMLAAINLSREDVYICNIVKCRPPANRNPEPDEVKACRDYLVEQIRIIQPEYILLLGRVAAHNLLETGDPLSRLRGNNFKFEGANVLATYHPSALLRNPTFKKGAWVDLQRLRDLMGIAPKSNK